MALSEHRVRVGWGRWLRSGLVVWSSWSALACTELAPGSDTLEQGVGQSRLDAGPPDPRWACLDEPAPGGAARLVPTVELTLAVTDTVTDLAPAGLTARACAKIDVACATPLATPMGADANGLVHLTVPQAFDGFVEILSPATVSTMYFLNRQLMQDATEALAVVSRVALGALAAQGAVTLDPALGAVLIRAFDCVGTPASGIELSNSVGGLPFAFVDGLPNVGKFVTEQDGVGGFVNVPVGYAVVQGRRLEGNRVLGTANVLVRQGWFTYGDVEPRPQ